MHKAAEKLRGLRNIRKILFADFIHPFIYQKRVKIFDVSPGSENRNSRVDYLFGKKLISGDII